MLKVWQDAEKALLIHSRVWYEKACAEQISSRITCSVTCLRKRGSVRIIRCVPSGPWWTECSFVCREGLTACMLRWAGRRFRPRSCCARSVQMLYSIRSERLLMEEMDYNLLFRWFVGLNADDEVWDPTTFTKNRDRLLQADVAKMFLALVVAQASAEGLTSDEHFTVDGTLLEAWAGGKSFQAKEGKPGPPPDDPGNPTVNFHGEQRSNDTHESTSDPEARMARKGAGKESKLSYSGNLLVENRNGLIVAAEVFQANGTAERDAALVMLEKVPGAGSR